MVTSLGEAREVTRLPGRTPAWSSGRTYALLHPPADVSREAAFDVGNGCTTQGALAARGRRVKRCGFTAVGTSRVSARQPTYFSCFAKRSRQEKATLRWRSAARTAHAASTEIGKRPKLATLVWLVVTPLVILKGVGVRDFASHLRQRTLLYPISVLATCRHLTGFTATATATSKATATATATATVAARNVKNNGNGNCRCAGLHATATVAARSNPNP